MASLVSAHPKTLQRRLAALTPRERVFVGLGAAALLLFLLYLMLRGEEEPVVLAEAPPQMAAPVAPPVTYAPAPQPVQPAAPSASAAGMLLIGVFGGGPGGGAAVMTLADGTQRSIRAGREFQPGLTLKQIGLNHVIIASAGGDLRLELGKAGAISVASAPMSIPGPAASSGNSADHRGETMAYRIGLQPIASGGRIRGFAIKPDAKLPHLERAGLVAGDVIVGVNGSAFDEERLMELSWTIANSSATEFEFVRAGRKMKVALQP